MWPRQSLHAFHKSIEREKVMKTVALLLIAIMALAVVGCSDDSTPPVSPTDQSVQAPASLKKSFSTEFTGKMLPDYADPNFIIDLGFTKYPDGKILMRGFREKIMVFNVTILNGPLPDLLTGPGEVELNGISDPIAGVGQWQTKVTLMPTAALGGVWEFTTHAKATLSEGYWTIPLKATGHGKGGALSGMQCRMEVVITAPADLAWWTGEAHGFITSH
jgi:hypothetical protein